MEFSSAEDARKAIDNFNRKVLHERPIVMEFAREVQAVRRPNTRRLR